MFVSNTDEGHLQIQNSVVPPGFARGKTASITVDRKVSLASQSPGLYFSPFNQPDTFSSRDPTLIHAKPHFQQRLFLRCVISLAFEIVNLWYRNEDDFLGFFSN